MCNFSKKFSFDKNFFSMAGLILFVIAITPNLLFAGKYRTIEAHLQHETKGLNQAINNKGFPCGCGPTAWTIVFDYWKQYKGKTNLVGSSNEELKQTMLKLANILGTTYGTFKGKKYGRTTPKKMLKACNYVKSKGYKCSIQRIRGSEFSKFWKVKAALDQDKPVIILINDPAKAFSSLHYPIIEKAELKQKKVAGKWRDRDVRYYVNMQGKNNHKWIWVREVGRNTHKHTGSFSMFIVDIK